MRDKDYISPSLLSSTETGHQVFLREYPWHPSVGIQDCFAEGESLGEIKTAHWIPCAKYIWEQGSDLSSNMTIRCFVPSPSLIGNLELRADRTSFNRWVNPAEKSTFRDPSVEFNGPSYALVDSEEFGQMLRDKKLVAVWLIGGEKMIFDESSALVKARMVFNEMLCTNGDGPVESHPRYYMEGQG